MKLEELEVFEKVSQNARSTSSSATVSFPGVQRPLLRILEEYNLPGEIDR